MSTIGDGLATCAELELQNSGPRHLASRHSGINSTMLEITNGGKGLGTCLFQIT